MQYIALGRQSRGLMLVSSGQVIGSFCRSVFESSDHVDGSLNLTGLISPINGMLTGTVSTLLYSPVTRPTCSLSRFYEHC